MQKKVFVGFGFGAIQGGLFLFEAFQSKNFDRLVVAEVMPDVVDAIRRNYGTYSVNVATRTGLQQHQITGLEIYNPTVLDDREALVAAVAEAQELATALPSVDFFTRGVAGILADGLKHKMTPAVLYAGENHNHAAEILGKAVNITGPIQLLNTVIGKMSKVVTDASEITAQKLVPLAPGLNRALLVEEFNRILITRITLPGFRRGITVFEEKPDLLPFEEAKLYGHNATHALLGYLANQQGCKFMSEAGRDVATFAREAFLEESGQALIHKRGGLDPLFTTAGYTAYVDDLMERMVNPYLRDAVERVIRDPRRKLAWDDRLMGTMRLALDAGIQPRRFAKGAAAALDLIATEKNREQVIDEILASVGDNERKREIKKLILSA